MSTRAAAVLGGCLIAAASIFVLGSHRPETSPVIAPGPAEPAPPADVRAKGDDGVALGTPSATRDVARLEALLREAQADIHELRRQLNEKGTEGTTAGAEADRVAKSASRFLALQAKYAAGEASKEESAELMRLAKDSAVMSHVVGELQRRIAEDPNDIAARLELADVQSARVHMVESIRERSELGRAVGEQIGEVLKREPENWKARFMRAVGISHSQRTPKGRADAIKEFESLVALQQRLPSEPRFAQTYGQLAQVYLAERDTARATQTVREGLARHPADKALKDLLERLEKDG